MLRIDRRLFLHFDWALLAFTFFIPFCGLVVLYSAGYDQDAVVDLFGFVSVPFDSAACLKQAVYLVVGLLVMVIGMSIPTHIFQRYAFVIYALGVVLLLAVDTVGVVVKGSQRWLDLGGFNLQPAECMKLGLLLAIARVIAPGAVVVIEHARGAIMGPGGVPGIDGERDTTRRYGDSEITVIWTPGEGT